MQNQSMRNEHKDFHLAPTMFYKSHHSVQYKCKQQNNVPHQ